MAKHITTNPTTNPANRRKGRQMKSKLLQALHQVVEPQQLQEVAVADLVLEEVIDRKDHPLIFTGAARQYRADCQAGQFKIGANKMTGNTLQMEMVAARMMEGEFFGYDSQKWLNVIFVDKDGVVSAILFKTESMDNLLEMHRQAVAEGKVLLGKTIKAQMSRRVSRVNGEGYYAVEFEVTGEGTYSAAIAHFRKETVINSIYRMPMAKPDRHAEGTEEAA